MKSIQTIKGQPTPETYKSEMDSAGRNIHAQLNMLEKAIELGVVAVEPKRLIDELHPFAVSGEMRAIRHQPGPADGLLGPRTTAAVKAFQRNRGLPPTGQVTEELRALLEVKLQQR